MSWGISKSGKSQRASTELQRDTIEQGILCRGAPMADVLTSTSGLWPSGHALIASCKATQPHSSRRLTWLMTVIGVNQPRMHFEGFHSMAEAQKRGAQR